MSRICRTLFELGYLDWEPSLDKYFVSAQVLALGYPYLTGLQVRHVARPLMQVLADRIEGAVSMGVAHRLDVTYLQSCIHNEGTPARPDTGACARCSARPWGVPTCAPCRRPSSKA